LHSSDKELPIQLLVAQTAVSSKGQYNDEGEDEGDNVLAVAAGPVHMGDDGEGISLTLPSMTTEEDGDREEEGASCCCTTTSTWSLTNLTQAGSVQLESLSQ
jgi:hypothetical protein